MAALKEIKKPEAGEIVVLVDTDTSKENVCRAAKSQGWQAKKIEPEGVGFKITLAKG
jgi:KaiC/GvpD/RAD55 family RecA-like ATPase